jgi:hypothetical protein
MKVSDAVRISISIPIYFTSISYPIDGINHRWCDGGILLNYPMYYYDICELENEYIKTFNELSIIKNNHIVKMSNNEKQYDFHYSYHYNTIGIMILNRGNNRDEYNYFSGFDQVNSITQFIEAFFNTILDKIDKDNFYNPFTGIKNNFFNRTITVSFDDKVSPINFDLTDNVRHD